jgi:hypothetical protein
VRPGVITHTTLSFQRAGNESVFFEIATMPPKYCNLTTGLADVVGGGLGSANQYRLKLGAAL